MFYNTHGFQVDKSLQKSRNRKKNKKTLFSFQTHICVFAGLIASFDSFSGSRPVDLITKGQKKFRFIFYKVQKNVEENGITKSASAISTHTCILYNYAMHSSLIRAF